MIRTVGRALGLSLLYAAAVEFPLALCFWHVGIPTGRPIAPSLLLAFSQLPGMLVFDSLSSNGELPLEATAPPGTRSRQGPRSPCRVGRSLDAM